MKFERKKERKEQGMNLTIDNKDYFTIASLSKGRNGRSSRGKAQLELISFAMRDHRLMSRLGCVA